MPTTNKEHVEVSTTLQPAIRLPVQIADILQQCNNNLKYLSLRSAIKDIGSQNRLISCI